MVNFHRRVTFEKNGGFSSHAVLSDEPFCAAPCMASGCGKREQNSLVPLLYLYSTARPSHPPDVPGLQLPHLNYEANVTGCFVLQEANGMICALLFGEVILMIINQPNQGHSMF